MIKQLLQLSGKFLLVSLCLFLISCSENQYYVSGPTTAAGAYGAVGGAMIGAGVGGGLGAGFGVLAGGAFGIAIGQLIERNQTLLQRLQTHGVKIIAVGDNLLLVLPSDIFFYPDSPNRRQSASPMLDDIATLIRAYEKITVKVSAYTDDACSSARALFLTQQQAQKIVDFLWASGTDTRIMYARGFGDSDPIATNMTDIGRAQNRRIQITLRALPGCCVLGPGSGGE